MIKYFKIFTLMFALVLAPPIFPMESTQTNKTEIVSVVQPKTAPENFVLDFVYRYFLYIILFVLVMAAFIIHMLLKRDARLKAIDGAVKAVYHSHDVIEEAGTYINYGRYVQAENTLLTALKKDNTNIKLWELLLSVYAESYNRSGFEKSLQDIPETVLNAQGFQETLRTLNSSIYNEIENSTEHNASLAKVQHSTEISLESSPAATTQAQKFAFQHDEMQIDFNLAEASSNRTTDEYDLKNIQLIDDEKRDSVIAIDTAYSESTVENPNATKLDLVKAYIEMGNLIAARTLLDQVLLNAPSEAQARQLLTQLDRTS